MLKGLLLIWLLSFCIPDTSCLFNDTIGAGQLLRNVIQAFNAISTPSIPASANPEAIKQLEKFREELERLSRYRVPSYDSLKESTVYLGNESTKIQEQAKIISIIASIDGQFITFLRTFGLVHDFWNNRDHFLDTFAVQERIDFETLHGFITPLKSIDSWNAGFFNSIANQKTNNSKCGEDQKRQNFLLTFYRTVILSEIKAHLILAFHDAYKYRAIDDLEARLRRRLINVVLDEQLLAYSNALSNSLRAMNTSYFRYCDSSYNSWIQDVSSFELNGFLQEVMFRYETPFCSASCWDIWNATACSREWFDNRTSCNGQVTSCAWLGETKGCALKEGPRKYRWIQSTELGLLGDHSGSCPEDQGYRIGTQQRSGRNPEKGCYCHCLENQWRVYLGPLESEENDNYVITGVRFRLKDDVLFLQPAQGRVHPNGFIVDYEWVDLPDIIPDEYIGRIDLDYHSFFLDDLQLDPEHALTGIQFHAVERGNNRKVKGFAISITGRPLDYKSGRLNLTANKRVIKVLPSGLEKESVYKRVKPLDTEIFERKESLSQDSTYVRLQQSDLTHDFGQSTLPLFDSTPVVMERHSPLEGIAIFHKGSTDNSGFISVQVRPMSYLPYIEKLKQLYVTNATEDH